MVEEKKETKDRYELKTVATETSQVLYDTETNTDYNTAEALVVVLNKIEELKNSIT